MMATYSMRRKMLLISRLSLIGLFVLIGGYAVPKILSKDGMIAPHTDSVTFSKKIVTSGLRDPWELTEGPDENLWLTESKSYRVLQIDPKSGAQTVLADLAKNRNFHAGDDTDGNGIPWPQGGLMGMALHPQLLNGSPYVYLAYVHTHTKGNRFLVRLERYKYNSEKKALIEPQIICDTVPASNDHNGGRMTIANVGGKPYLFYAVGDMGSGQFSNGGTPNQAQNVLSYEGKILRYALEPKEGAAGEASWIPADNPFDDTKKTAVWSTGHRNPQGLASAVIDGKELLFSSEHGPYSDDEVNLIYKGKNYGHPLIIGYADGNYDGLAASVSDNKNYPGKWHTSYPLISSERENVNRLGKSTYQEPIKSFYPTSNSHLKALFSSVQRGQKSEWKAWAPAGIAIYTANNIPGWKNSVLIATLKGGTLLQLKLNDKGQVAGEVVEHEKGNLRYRDIEVSKNGNILYLITDSSSVTSGPSASEPASTNCRGCIIQLQYTSPQRTR